ncbi:hypothetical protein ETU10_03710 [Apibacter muscae]|uniref:hypothetical protein n=1 Tax=Apibacter muscae TaxID=2509004 RepID=UPI0011AC9821|nr:hypothetical protein [Apibacter muscae]TWP24359.1 hypothetical protein ETU10_03710 [Apibacter muscae]
MDKYDALEKLKKYSQELNKISYDEIYNLLKNGIKKIPLPEAKLSKGAFIDRVRKNNDNELFTHINDLGYIKDPKIIDKCLNSFGRANCPHQVMFYGAIETTLIDKQRATAIFETSNLFRHNLDSTTGEYYTVSRWKSVEEITLVEVVFSEYSCNNNPDIKHSYNKQIEFLQKLNLSEEDEQFFIDFLKFISDEFSKKVNIGEDYNYKISAAYTNLVLENPNIQGIIYPSVQTASQGVNIVLPPKIVDDYLTPTICSTQIVYKKGKKTLIANGEYYCDTINIKENIIWKKTDPKFLSTQEQINEFFK